MTAEKDEQVARKKGRGGGGEVIRAMPERKHFFYMRASLTMLIAHPHIGVLGLATYMTF